MRIPPLMNFIWLKGAIPLVAEQNLRSWCRYLSLRNSTFEPVVWVDSSSLKASALQWKVVHDTFRPYRRDGIVTPYFLVLPERRVPLILHADALRANYPERFSHIPVSLLPAIDAECQFGLPQVASDILRILILFRFGGIYADMGGVSPGGSKFLDPNAIHFAEDHDVQPGFMSVGNSKVCENALIIADSASLELHELLEAMATYFKGNPRARVEWLEKHLADIGIDPRHVALFRDIIEVGLVRGEQTMVRVMRELASSEKILLVDQPRPAWVTKRIGVRLGPERERLEKQLSDPELVSLMGSEYVSRQRSQLEAEVTRRVTKELLTISIDLALGYRQALLEGNTQALGKIKSHSALWWLDDYTTSLSHSIKLAGYGKFLELFNSKPCEVNWSLHFATSFKVEQVGYSWMTPGLSKLESLRAEREHQKRLALQRMREQREQVERLRRERETLMARAQNIERGLRETRSARTSNIQAEAMNLAHKHPGLRYRGKPDP